MSPTAKDIYDKRFSELKYGAPLYRPCEVQLGDVGFIDIQDGFFQKLYNISNPPSKEFPGGPPPVAIKRISHKPERWDAIHLMKKRGWGISTRVNVPQLPQTEAQFSFTRVRNGECILIPGNKVVFERLEETGHLPQYMNNHYAWISRSFARSFTQFNTPASVVLVHRTVKTDRWAIAVNSTSETVQNVTFTVSSAASVTSWGEWSTKSSVGRSVSEAEPGVDYTLFIRRIALHPPANYFGDPAFSPSIELPIVRRLWATVTNTQPDWWVSEDDDDDHELEVEDSDSDNSQDV